MQKSKRSIGLTFVIIFIYASIIDASSVFAEPRSFNGITTNIMPNKSCTEKPGSVKMTLVFDGEPENAINGWFYGEGTSTAEFKRISHTRFEVTYAITRYNKLPPSIMELQHSSAGLRIVVQDHIPEDKEILEKVCFYEKMEAVLKPLVETNGDLKKRAKELFAADLIMLDADKLLYKQNEYAAAIAQANKALPLYVSNYGQWSKESRNASAIIIFALMYQDRFDEALDVLLPFQKALPDNTDVKELMGIILELKKEQDDLFRSDPNRKSKKKMIPIG